MSLLNQNSGNEPDDSSRGEDYAKGTSHIVWASIAAVLVVSAAIAIYVYAGHKPPVATGEVLEVWTHSTHIDSPAFDASGVALPPESMGQILVFARVRLHNQSKIPLFLIHLAANATVDDGIHTSYAATPSDYKLIFVAYPRLAQWQDKPLPTDLTLQPGQTVEGTFVTTFHLTPQQWQARKNLDFGFTFRYQPVLTLTLPPQITIQER